MKIKKALNNPPKGFMVNADRMKKANKIIKLISEFSDFKKTDVKAKLLDIGTGNGEIASYLGQYYNVTSIDISDQREILSDYKFIQVKHEIIPLPDNSIDVVVSNHVIEHVQDAEQHLSEMYRVLKDNGIIYLASPNRLWPFEVHYKIWLLHYLPYSWFHFLLKTFKKYKEDVKLLSWWQIKKMVKNKFNLEECSSQITKNPLDYEMNVSPSTLKIIDVTPLWIMKALVFMNPTLVVILRKRSEYTRYK